MVLAQGLAENPSESSIPIIAPKLLEENPHVQVGLLSALGRIDSVEATHNLIRAFTHSNSDHIKHLAIGNIAGRRDATSIDFLKRVAQSEEDVACRVIAISGLGESDDKSAIPILESILKKATDQAELAAARVALDQLRNK